MSNLQNRTNTDILGIDVSNYQGIIDWNQVKASGVQFAYVKASEGYTYIDPKFATNVKNAKAAGLLVGAYHFAWPNQDSATSEAKHFVELLQANPTDLVPVLDLEEPGNNIVQWVRDFVDYVKQQTGKQVMLYTGKWFADRYNDFNGALSDLPLWISAYQNTAPTNFGGWDKWVAWQYADNGSISGISGNVDMDVVSVASLDLLKGGDDMKKVKVQINGTAITDGVVVGQDTYVIWTALGKAAGNVQAQPIDGGWNFTTPQQQPVQLDKDATQKVINVLSAEWNLPNDPVIQKAIAFAADALRDAAGIPKQ